MGEKKSFVKKVLSREELYIEFSDEEMRSLGIAPGDKFELIADSPSEGALTLKKMVPLDIDLSQFDQATLIGLVQASVKEQKPVDDIIRQSLESLLTSGHEKP